MSEQPPEQTSQPPSDQPPSDQPPSDQPPSNQPPSAEGAASPMGAPGEGAPGQSPVKDPQTWTTGDEPITGPQASYLETLAREAGETVPDGLTKARASELIDRLQGKTGRGQGGSGQNSPAQNSPAQIGQDAPSQSGQSQG